MSSILTHKKFTQNGNGNHIQTLPVIAYGGLQVMKRMCGIEWPGGVGPRAVTLRTMGQQMMELAAQYADRVTHAYISTATHTNNIPVEASTLILLSHS